MQYSPRRAARRSAAAAAARLATRPRVGGASTGHDRGVAGARLSSLLSGTTARCSSGSVSSAGAVGGVARILFTSGEKVEGVADTAVAAAAAAVPPRLYRHQHVGRSATACGGWRHEEGEEEETGNGGAIATLDSPSRVMMAQQRRPSRMLRRKPAPPAGGAPAPPTGGGAPHSGGNGVLTATNALLVINFLVFLQQQQDPSVTTSFYNLAYAITDHGEWYRLVTAMMLHGGWVHLASNSMALFNIGRGTETYMGTEKFVALYVCSGVSGNVLSCIVDPLSASLGASGAIFGLLGAEAMIHLAGPKASMPLFVSSVGQTAFFAVLVGLVVPNIDHWGHLGGFVGGAALTLLIQPRSPRK
ncbi:unnamed protein product [Ectocarpus sp. CCAP 1310/34]|nr:unnamed protein product [Ectocarpus sp. CCAP 1310/34]